MSSLKAGLIVLAILAIPLFLIIPDRAQVLVQSDIYEATIESCKSRKSIRVRGSNGRRLGWGYAPVALTEDNIKATGTLFLSDKKSCSRQIGDTASVFVDQNTGEGRINSFLQFWFFPWMILGAGFFLFFTFIRKDSMAVYSFLFTVVTTTLFWMIEIGKVF